WAGHDGAVVLGRLEVNCVGRARNRAQAAGDALFEPILIPHEHLFAPPLRKHRELLLGVVDRDGLLEQVLEGGGETDDERANHSHCPQFTRPIRSSKSKPCRAPSFSPPNRSCSPPW